jgi:hypothetical protein
MDMRTAPFPFRLGAFQQGVGSAAARLAIRQKKGWRGLSRTTQ